MKGLEKFCKHLFCLLLVAFLAINTAFSQGIMKLSSESAPTTVPNSTDSKSIYAITPKGAIWYFQSAATTAPDPVRAAGWYLLVSAAGVMSNDKYVVQTGTTFANGVLTIKQSGVTPDVTVNIASPEVDGIIGNEGIIGIPADVTANGTVSIQSQKADGTTTGVITVASGATSAIKVTGTKGTGGGAGVPFLGGSLKLELDLNKGVGTIPSYTSVEAAKAALDANTAIPSGATVPWRAASNNDMGYAVDTSFYYTKP